MIMTKELSAITLVNPFKILRSEHHIFNRVTDLYEKIVSEGIWSVPLTLEKKSHVLMDGHHRLQVALMMGLQYVPCILLDYSEVEVYSRRPGLLVTPEEIIRRGLSGDLYLEKSTRHIFKEEFVCHFPLSNLKINQAA